MRNCTLGLQCWDKWFKMHLVKTIIFLSNFKKRTHKDNAEVHRVINSFLERKMWFAQEFVKFLQSQPSLLLYLAHITPPPVPWLINAKDPVSHSLIWTNLVTRTNQECRLLQLRITIRSFVAGTFWPDIVFCWHKSEYLEAPSLTASASKDKRWRLCHLHAETQHCFQFYIFLWKVLMLWEQTTQEG